MPAEDINELPGYDPSTPITEHPMLAAYQFRDHFSYIQGSVLNAASGNANLQRDLNELGLALDVTSLDPLYGTAGGGNPYIPNKVYGFAQNILRADEMCRLVL